MIEIYTHENLRSLRIEPEKQQYISIVNRVVNEMCSAILSTAGTTSSTTYFRSFVLSNIILDVMAKLRTIFVGVSIEYRSVDENTSGVYVDWS